jgi:hypothetical protein
VNSASGSPRSAASITAAAAVTASAASGASTWIAATADSGIGPPIRTTGASRSGRRVTPATSADTTTRRGSPFSSAAIRRSEARAASSNAAYSSSSSDPLEYASRNAGVSAKAVPLRARNSPDVSRSRSIAMVAGR